MNKELTIKQKKSKAIPKGKSSLVDLNAHALKAEMAWLHVIIETRFKLYFQQDSKVKTIFDIPPPKAPKIESPYTKIVRELNMNEVERIILLLALAPHICPQLLDIFFTKNDKYGRGFTEFGGIKGIHHSGFLPTGETAAFLLAANDLNKRFNLLSLFSESHFFRKYNILDLVNIKPNEPLLSGVLTISAEYLTYFTSGGNYKPKFSNAFPAQQITTQLEWEDLVLDRHVKEDIQEIHNWLKYDTIIREDWKLGKIIKRGYRSLFYGPPGTGKTLTACLLGKVTGLEVYRIDLSKVVSKYIGETEKNLANIFDQAENKKWILFFDEADALFGKRTNTTDAKDRYANQEIAFLLQRIEDFPGLVILATNLKSNMDEAFSRRFQSMVYFAIPRPEQRILLWEKSFQYLQLAENVDLKKIAANYELTGGAIINILQYCALAAVSSEDHTIQEGDIIHGIRRELKKEGKTI